MCGPPPRAPCVLPGAAAGPAAAPGPYRYAAAGSAARLRDWRALRAAARSARPRAGKAAPRGSTPPLPLRGAPRGVGGAPPAAVSPRLHRAVASREIRCGPRGDRPSPGRCAAPLLRWSWPVSTLRGHQSALMPPQRRDQRGWAVCRVRAGRTAGGRRSTRRPHRGAGRTPDRLSGAPQPLRAPVRARAAGRPWALPVPSARAGPARARRVRTPRAGGPGSGAVSAAGRVPRW